MKMSGNGNIEVNQETPSSKQAKASLKEKSRQSQLEGQTFLDEH